MKPDEIDTIVDLIRTVDRDKAIHLFATYIKTAKIQGWLDGSQSASKTFDDVMDRERLTHTPTKGAA